MNGKNLIQDFNGTFRRYTPDLWPLVTLPPPKNTFCPTPQSQCVPVPSVLLGVAMGTLVLLMVGGRIATTYYADNGPASKLESFLEETGYRTTSPLHTRIQWAGREHGEECKTVAQNTRKRDQHALDTRIILENIPFTSTGRTPVEIVFGRSPRTHLAMVVQMSQHETRRSLNSQSPGSSPVCLLQVMMFRYEKINRIPQGGPEDKCSHVMEP